MKILIYAALLFATLNATAQVKEDDIKPMMQHRIYTCFEVEYNSILLAPGLYRAARYDTLDALIAFWQRHCAFNERLFSIGVLNSIRNNNFKEYLGSNQFLMPRAATYLSDSDLYRPNVLQMLVEYKGACKGAFSDKNYRQWSRENYAVPKDMTAYYSFYEGYYEFLREMARSLAGKRAYSPAEQFLLRFYASPDSVKYAELDSALYTGTTLQELYRGYRRYNKEIHGGSLGMTAGAWVPTGRLAVLGTHPYMGWNMGGKSFTTAWDLVIGVRFLRSPNAYTVVEKDSLYTTRHFSGMYIGFDVSHKLFRAGKHQLDFQWGIGYDAIQTLKPADVPKDNSGSAITNYISTGYINPGLAYRFYVKERVSASNHKYSYLSLQGRYHICDYKNPGGTDVHGNFITIGLVYGFYSHGYTKYPYLK